MTDPRPAVLVAEDEAPLRRVLERALDRAGYRVLGAGSAETAYDLLESHTVDAVLLDIHLPTMSGLALYLAIVHRWPTLTGRIALMTGDVEGAEVQAWLARNPCAVLRKPFHLQEIFDWLTGVTRVRPRERANG